MLSTKKDEKKINEARAKEIEAAKEVLSGKVSIIWIFVIGGKIDPEDKNRILNMYNGLSSDKYIAPLCKAGI